MFVAGLAFLTHSSKRARAAWAGAAITGSAVAVTLVSGGCSSRFGAAGCTETRTCTPSGEGGAPDSTPGGSPSDNAGGDAGSPGGTSDTAGKSPTGGAPDAPTDAGAAGVAGETSSGVEIAVVTLPSGKTYVPYSATLSASGASHYTWSLASGTLPAGLALADTSAADLELEGTPTEAGLFPLTFNVTDGTTSAELKVTLAITHAVLFLSDRDAPGVNELYLSELGDSTAPTPVRLNASLPNGGGVASYAWSPDGSKVLYIAKQSAGGAPELWVASVAAPGTAKRVSDAGLIVSKMAWLGKGNIGAYMTSDGAAFLIDLSGSTPGKSKLAVAAAGKPDSLLPSPNGDSISVSTQNAGSGESAISYVTWGAEAPSTVPLAQGMFGPLQYSYDGRFGSVQAPGGGVWLDLASATPTPHGGVLSASWSPKREALLHVEVGSGALLLGTFKGANLTSTQLVPTSPCPDSITGYGTAWSADGVNALIACSRDVRGISDVATAPVSTDFSLLPSGFSSGATNADANVRAPALSADSRWVALGADRDIDEQYDLYLVRWAAPGTTYKPYSNSIAPGVANWAFAPSSRTIAFVGTVSPQAEPGLYLTDLPVNGAPPPATLVSSVTSTVQGDIGWLPGSRALTYRATVAGKAQLFALLIGADGAAITVVPISGASGGGVPSYQLAPLQ